MNHDCFSNKNISNNDSIINDNDTSLNFSTYEIVEENKQKSSNNIKFLNLDSYFNKLK